VRSSVLAVSCTTKDGGGHLLGQAGDPLRDLAQASGRADVNPASGASRQFRIGHHLPFVRRRLCLVLAEPGPLSSPRQARNRRSARSLGSRHGMNRSAATSAVIAKTTQPPVPRVVDSRATIGGSGRPVYYCLLGATTTSAKHQTSGRHEA